MTLADWLVVAVLCGVSLAVGLHFTRSAGKKGEEGYFTANRNLPWWAVGLSNCATYQSGGGGFVMLVLAFGIAGNWIWWSSWIMWMPLVAVIWAPMWRRMRIVTTAELITLRYGGKPAVVARKIYAFIMFCTAVLIIGYITGFFAKTIAPLVTLSEFQILLLFGGVTALYSMLGGLSGVVFVDVVQFGFLMAGSFVLLFFAVPQLGGWDGILEAAVRVRPESLKQFPPVPGIDMYSILVFIVIGMFFAGSPTAGEGMTAQRFMAAKNERHAIGGQLFNAFIALSFRTIPLIAMGIMTIGLFWTNDLTRQLGEAPQGLKVLEDPAYAWGELIKYLDLPVGFVGILVAIEAAAFMSTLSSLINWGGSFIINDYFKSLRPEASPGEEVVASRIATFLLFVFSMLVAVFFVEGLIGWFMFINSAMVSFILPLAFYRFFWSRFNVWGELTATVVGLPMSIVVWFVLGFKDRPYWQGLGLLFCSGALSLFIAAILTPPESGETLTRFYERCRPIGFWGGIRSRVDADHPLEKSAAAMLLDSALGILACLGLVVATNSMLVESWGVFFPALAGTLVFGSLLIRRYGSAGERGNRPDFPVAEET